jgi:lipoic acid synthetase
MKIIKLMKLKHCVITSVDRDDLDDLGANFWAATIKKIKELNPNTTIEVLIPDFQGKKHLIQKVIDANPDVISHNLETVRSLSDKIRTKAKYDISLSVLEYISSKGIRAKSGIMLGLGESESEIYETMDDLLSVNCKIITIGQYLQPTKENISVQKYVSDEEFAKYKKIALQKGFEFVESSSLVRSSYHAEKHAVRNVF